MNTNMVIGVDSEVGELEGVILHKPGKEVENMTPKNVQRALYSDILNLAVVRPEYDQLRRVLTKLTRTFFIHDLLAEVLKNEACKTYLVDAICRNENTRDIVTYLLDLPAKELGRQLIEGVILNRDSLTKFLSKEYYALRPLHNFFFTRDAAITMPNWVLIGKMANQVRERERMIVKAIFDYHPQFKAKTVAVNEERKERNRNISIEGGDVLVARKDLLLIGLGSRTTPQGIDFIVEELKKDKTKKHIIVQELPETPESFIHLDMVFTFLDVNTVMVYEPIILKPNSLQTVHIEIDNGKVSSIRSVESILEVLNKLGFDPNPVICGGVGDSWTQQREQWHSGANFFALGPGKVIGYARNVHTLEEMNRNGFEIIDARAVIKNKVDLTEYKKYVLTIHGAELSRGGGGCRCMTMPIKRKPLDM